MDLMVKLDVGERTIRKDLDLIQKPPYNALLTNEYRGKERVYRYKNTEYNLPLFNDNDDVRRKLDDAIKAVEQYEGTPQYDWLKLFLMAIENGNVEGMEDIMSFENNAYLEGTEYIKPLTEAIVNKYPIKLLYQPYRAEEREIYVHPYYLKQYNNRWFLIGKPEDVDAIHNYAVDRIKSVEHLSKPYIDSAIDFEEYFDDVIGVSIYDTPIENVVLMISKNRYPYIKTKPLHWSQKHQAEQDTENAVCLTLKVRPNYELITLIMSFGADIEVVAPQSLRDTITSNVEQMYKHYLLR